MQKIIILSVLLSSAPILNYADEISDPNLLILPKDGSHLLQTNRPRKFNIPGDWSKCLVYQYDVSIPPHPISGRNFALNGIASPDGRIRLTPDKSKCPPGGYYEDGHLLGQNQIIVSNTIYHINTKAEIIHQATYTSPTTKTSPTTP